MPWRSCWPAQLVRRATCWLPIPGSPPLPENLDLATGAPGVILRAAEIAVILMGKNKPTYTPTQQQAKMNPVPHRSRRRISAATSMEVGTEFTFWPPAHHGGHNFISNDQAANVGSAGFPDEFLHQNVDVGAAKRLDHALGCLACFGEHHTDTLRTLEQFDDDRRATDSFDCRQDVVLVHDERRLRDADVVAAEDLQAAQLVAPRQWEIIEVEKPRAAAGQMLVRLERVAVCGTDKPYFCGVARGYPMPPGTPGHMVGLRVKTTIDGVEVTRLARAFAAASTPTP